MGLRTLWGLGLLVQAIMAETCLSQGELAGVVFGSVFGTLVICIAVAAILWMFLRKTPEKTSVSIGKAAYVNAVCDTTERGCGTPDKKSDKFTLIDSYKLKRKSDFSQQKSFSTENVNEVDGRASVHLNSSDLGGLGFAIMGNMTEGIFVKNVLPQGPAQESGNVFEGDRIRSMWIDFEQMVYEDAVTLLSYASPYKVKLELERKLEESEPEGNTTITKPVRVHPLFRSNTLRNVHFNPIGTAPVRVASESSKQKYRLPVTPREQMRDQTSDEQSTTDSERVYEVIGSESGQENEEKMESVENTERSEKKTDSEREQEEKDKSKMSSSDYSSTSDVSSMSHDSPQKLSGQNSIDNGSMNESEGSNEEISQKEISERLEILPTVTSPLPQLSPTPPISQKCTVIPPRPVRICQKPPSPSSIPRNTRSASSPPSQRKTSIPTKKSMGTGTVKSRIPPPTARAPDFTEVRVSRIPRRESTKETVVERKLPRVPSSTMNRSNTEDKDSTIWSRLYQEKKGQLKKTREVRAKSEDPIMLRVQYEYKDRYGTLRRDRAEKLTQNDEILEKQMEELRQLGVI